MFILPIDIDDQREAWTLAERYVDLAVRGNVIPFTSVGPRPGGVHHAFLEAWNAAEPEVRMLAAGHILTSPGETHPIRVMGTVLEYPEPTAAVAVEALASRIRWDTPDTDDEAQAWSAAFATAPRGDVEAYVWSAACAIGMLVHDAGLPGTDVISPLQIVSSIIRWNAEDDLSCLLERLGDYAPGDPELSRAVFEGLAMHIRLQRYGYLEPDDITAVQISLGLTQRQLAERAGVPPSALNLGGPGKRRRASKMLARCIREVYYRGPLVAPFGEPETAGTHRAG